MTGRMKTQKDQETKSEMLDNNDNNNNTIS